MSAFEVPQPILNAPFEEPREHWHIEHWHSAEGEVPETRPGRRPAMYYSRDPTLKPEKEYGTVAGTAIELKLVNLYPRPGEEVAIGRIARCDTHYFGAAAMVVAGWASAAALFCPA